MVIITDTRNHLYASEDSKLLIDWPLCFKRPSDKKLAIAQVYKLGTILDSTLLPQAGSDLASFAAPRAFLHDAWQRAQQRTGGWGWRVRSQTTA
jgi:hypothetical protein